MGDTGERRLLNADGTCMPAHVYMADDAGEAVTLSADEIRYQGEATVDALLARAGVPVGTILSPLQIARRLLGRDCIIRNRSSLLGSLGRLGEQHYITVRAGLPDAIALWLIGHELAHWLRGSSCARGAKGANAVEEQICDYAGAGLQMPRVAFQIRVNALGLQRPWRQLALDFGTTQTSAALRLGEVEERAIAVVCRDRGRIYARGPSWYTWPIAERLHELAERGGPGVARARIGDALRRWVLVPRTG